MPSWTEKARDAADEIIELCRSPVTLVELLAGVTSRRKRPGVVSDTWSYRNQLLVAIRGYQEARGFRPWLEVGRRVKKGHSAFHIIAPRLVTRRDSESSRREQGETSESKAILIGYRAVPVFGLEQTQPDEAWTEQSVYHPLDGETGRTQLVVDGYRVPWWEWYSTIRKKVMEKAAAELGAAIVAHLSQMPTELNDPLKRLGEYPADELAEQIEPACLAVVEYLNESGRIFQMP